MKLDFNSNCKPCREKLDLNVVIADDTVTFPEELRMLAKRANLRTVLQMISVFEYAPTEISKALNWNVDEVVIAGENLFQLLHQTYPDNPEFHLHEKKPRAYGARL